MRPGPRDVPGGIATTTDDEEREVERFDVGDAAAVAFDVQVEATEAVMAETVGATL